MRDQEKKLDQMNQRCMDLMRDKDSLDTKKQAIERQFELNKKMMNEKVNQLNEVIDGEKNTRMQWQERYDNLSADNLFKTGALANASTDLNQSQQKQKDAELMKDKLEKQVEVLSEQNQSYLNLANKAKAKTEQLTRELKTQHEIMKKFDATKKEQINKLKRDLDTVEERFHKVINENNMVGEDIRSRAYMNLEKAKQLKNKVKKEKKLHEET